MSGNITMRGKDAVYAGLAECFITIDGKRYNFMSLTEFESRLKTNIVKVNILGKVGAGHKAAGSEGTWSAKAHYNQSVIREMMRNYQKSGELQYFEIQVSNEDPTSSVGRQTIVHKDCLCDEITLAKFAAGDDLLEEKLSGTFDDWDMPEAFSKMDGFETN